jgi:hypothetical protein
MIVNVDLPKSIFAQSGRYSHFQRVAPELLDTYVAEQKSLIHGFNIMTRRESERLILILSEHFKIKPPSLLWRAGTKRGKANKRNWRISSGPDVWRGQENSLLHEFAHILHYHRGFLGGPHGDVFQYILWEVVCAWHGDPSLYGWQKEYANVSKFGLRRIKETSSKPVDTEQTPLVSQSVELVQAAGNEKRFPSAR